MLGLFCFILWPPWSSPATDKVARGSDGVMGVGLSGLGTPSLQRPGQGCVEGESRVQPPRGKGGSLPWRAEAAPPAGPLSSPRLVRGGGKPLMFSPMPSLFSGSRFLAAIVKDLEGQGESGGGGVCGPER